MAKGFGAFLAPTSLARFECAIFAVVADFCFWVNQSILSPVPFDLNAFHCAAPVLTWEMGEKKLYLKVRGQVRAQGPCTLHHDHALLAGSQASAAGSAAAVMPGHARLYQQCFSVKPVAGLCPDARQQQWRMLPCRP
ncbi:hypothetical protein B0T11DRAFT_98864 [Plectosphaerella cucumerina]|uniref:Uncharacterized protein n=1 Tax=Plectosphaerella cucumerina TaxID=40658 RepID=A0A8K0TAH7_9PEZI|nr:hypothetical protein B0T11DRAFT_98864 [Plectosphaerella cucumerina]